MVCCSRRLGAGRSDDLSEDGERDIVDGEDEDDEVIVIEEFIE
jgi:hypothetical protein